MLDRQQLATFAMVVHHQHFRRAAAALNISSGAVSQRFKVLEQVVGALLLVREPVVVPTRAGEEVLRYITSIQLREGKLLQCVMPGCLAPADFALAVNPDSLATWFGPVSRALARLPMALEIVVDDQDHTLGALARVEVKSCVSTASKALAGFVAEFLGQCATAACQRRNLQRHHKGTDLSCPMRSRRRPFFTTGKMRCTIPFLSSRFGVSVGRYVRHYFPSPSALLNANLDELGYGLVPAMLAETAFHRWTAG